jgi:hypothetical protein
LQLPVADGLSGEFFHLALRRSSHRHSRNDHTFMSKSLRRKHHDRNFR